MKHTQALTYSDVKKFSDQPRTAATKVLTTTEGGKEKKYQQ